MNKWNKAASRFTLVLLLLSFSLVIIGCPKKAPPPEDKVEPKVVTDTKVKEAPYEPAEAEKDVYQEAAIKGDDIPLRKVEKDFYEPTPEEKRILKTIYFDYDKSNIRAEYREVLDRVGQWASDNPKRQLLIEGHCDERGTNEYNLALGERRALSVRRYLVGLGVHPERLHTISYGEEKPADAGHSEDAWSKNRRAQFKVSAPE